MIEFPRSLARQLWAVLRRAVPKPHGPHGPLVEFQTGPKGLYVRVAHPEVSVEFQQPGANPAESVKLPMVALADFEGKSPDVVTLERNNDGQVIARWQDAGMPQVNEYEAGDGDKAPAFPDSPDRLVRNPPGLLKALEEAGHCTASDSVRYALHRLQLRGRSGEVVATDGKQLLLQGGYHFPWEEDVLMPSVPVFGSRELGQEVHVEIGRTKQRVVVRIGSWTFHLRIDTEGRFPKVGQVIPKLGAGATHWRIAPEDAAFLARALPRLPAEDDADKPLTVDLNGQVCLRARDSRQGRISEVVLARSEYTGRPVRFSVNRQFLARVLQLGFDEVHVQNADSPLLCQDNQRTFVVMPLPKAGCIAPTEDALRVVSAQEEQQPPPTSPERKKTTMPSPSSNVNGHAAEHHNPRVLPAENGNISAGSVIAEAQALKDTLRDAYGRVNRLVAALKRQKKQSKLVQTTLASLKQLQQIES